MLKPSVKGSEAAAGSCNSTRDFACRRPSFRRAERGCCDAWLCLAMLGWIDRKCFFQPKSREKSSPGWLPLLTTWNMWRMHWPKLGIVRQAASLSHPATMTCPSNKFLAQACATDTRAHLHTHTHQTVSLQVQCKKTLLHSM